MNLDKFLEDIKAKTKEIEDVKQELVDKLKPNFKDIFIPFLQDFPEVKYVRWEQYTPYFNDGEPCKFSVCELRGFLETEDECDYDGSLPDYWVDDVKKYRENGLPEGASEWTVKRLEEKDKEFPEDLTRIYERDARFRQVAEALSNIPDDIMLTILGDHSQVKVTVDGIDVEEYAHD